MKLWGTQIAFVEKVFQSRSRPTDAGSTTAAELSKRLQLAREYTKVIMQIVISLTGLVGSVLLLLYSKDASVKKLACSTIGLITGYWLR
jgi:hypothetical protein